MRRTVNVSFNPCPRRPITTPEKTWMRSLSPSTTFVCTRTVSPTANCAASFRNCSDSILSNIAWFIKFVSICVHLLAIYRSSWFDRMFALVAVLAHQIRPPFARAQPGLLGPPAGDLRMITRQQYFGYFHPAKFRRPGILRILQQTMTEGFFLRALLIAQHTG